MLSFSMRACLLAGVLLLTLGVTHAAGLGKLTVTSALGHPLRAEIELVSVQKDELASLTARLASPDAFKQAELEYAAALASVKVTVEKRPNGQPYIKLTSSQPIEEPILDMLIELSWASGRLVREYTALMDPPEYNVPAPAFAPAPIAKPESAPEPKAAAKTPPSGKITRAPEAPAQSAAGDGSYTVKPGDTLSKIARSAKVEGISLEQMLVGLYQNNREAFAGNMNRLKTGKILRVPDRETLAAVEPTAAVQEVKAQSSNWNAYRQKLAAAAGASAPSDSAAQSASGRINATVEDQAAGAADPGREVLKLSKGEQNATDQRVGGGAGGNALQERLHGLEEEATAREKALQEANERIAQLEGNVKSMQRLLEIKNESLAQAQNQANAQAKPPAVGALTPTVPSAQPAAEINANSPAQPAPQAAPATPPQAVQTDAKSANPVTPPAAVAQTPTDAAPVAVPAAVEAGFIERLLSQPLYLAMGAFIIALIGFAIVRRRRAQPEFENSIMTGGDLTGNTVFGDSTGGVVDTSDSSLITDFGKVGLDHISTDEVDPLAEAEVYIAYGRDAQAEEILKEALNKNPHRYEIHLKLLEIYAARQSLGAFETLAGELYATTTGQGEIWDKAAEMGRAIDPENPLYAPAQSADLAEPEDAFGQGESLEQATKSEFDFQPGALHPDVSAAPAERAMPDLRSHAVEIQKTASAPAAAIDRDHSVMNFDIEPIELEEKTGPIEAASAPDSMIDFDFDLGVPEAQKDLDDAAITLKGVEEDEVAQPTAHQELTQAADAKTLAPSFSLDIARQEAGDEIAGDSDRQPTPEPGLAVMPGDLSNIDLNFDAGKITERSEAPIARNDQWYDVQTKFDLAKAYQEMGDKEGAREILQEVVQEGDAEQQANSKAMLASLG